MSSLHSFDEFGPWSSLHMGDEGWSFIEGAWQENGEGVITPPSEAVDENMAFYTRGLIPILKRSSNFAGTRLSVERAFFSVPKMSDNTT